MVARHVEQRHIEAADDVLQVVEGKVPATKHDVGLQAVELVSVEPFVDLVRDRKDARQVMPGPLGAV